MEKRLSFKAPVKLVLSSFRRSVKNIALHVLRSVDETYESNATPLKKYVVKKSESVERQPQEIIISKGKDQPLSLAAILNEDGVITGADSIYLYFTATFPPNFVTKDEEALTNEILAKLIKIGQFADQTVFFDAIRKILKSHESPTSIKLQTQLEAHENDSKTNQQVYGKSNKLNPNAVFWPDPTDPKGGRSIFNEMPFAKTYGFVNKSTPIGSAGSCFAMEIAHRLQTENFNYVITERNPDEKLANACARWGIIFNTPSFRQLVDKAFGERALPKILWTKKTDDKIVYCDPFREDIFFSSVEEYENNYDKHIENVREALLKTKVFILTLGLNEVWYLKSDGSVFSRAPWRISSGLVGRKVLTAQDNLRELQHMLDIWRHHNKDIKFIISVSPVPLHATFRGDNTHVISANSHSKAILRTVAEEFVRTNKDVFYFPSYESVMYCTEKPWDADQRHVSRNAVNKVMGLFDTMFVKEFIVRL